jgi:hypothetical protein
LRETDGGFFEKFSRIGKDEPQENILGSPTIALVDQDAACEIARMQISAPLAARMMLEDDHEGKDSGNESQLDTDSEPDEKQKEENLVSIKNAYVGMNVSIFKITKKKPLQNSQSQLVTSYPKIPIPH